MDAPHYNTTADVDVSEALKFCKSENISSFLLMVYAITRTANQIENFRYRIRDKKVCLHELVSPSFTVMGEDELYYHCTAHYFPDLAQFKSDASARMQNAITNKTLLDSLGRDDLLYMSCLPWIKFTSTSHAMHYNPVDSVPRFYWGKYEETNGKTKMPFSCQVHHALVDGIHVGRYFNVLQDYLSNPEELMK